VAVGVENYGETRETQSLLAAAELLAQNSDWTGVDRTLSLGQPSFGALARSEEYWLLRAEAYEALGRVKAATDAYRVAIAIDPRSVAAQSALLWGAIRSDDATTLRQYVDAWRPNAAAHPELWSPYAVGLDRLGRTSEAIGYYERQLRAQPGDPLLALELAQALARVGRGELARRLERSAAATLRRDALAALHRGRLSEQGEQLVQFEAGVARDRGGARMGEQWLSALRARQPPGSADADAFRIEWYLAEDRIDEARRDLLGVRPERLGHRQWRQYRLTLALAENDDETAKGILAFPEGIDAVPRIEGLLAVNRDDLATTEIQNALARDEPGEHPEWREKLADIRFRRAPTWVLGGSYEYITGLDAFGPDVAAAYDLGQVRLVLSGLGRRFGVRDDSLALGGAIEEVESSALVRIASSRATTEVALGANGQTAPGDGLATVVPRASFLDRRRVGPSVGTVVQFVADDRIEDTGLLRLAAVRSQLDVGVRDEFGPFYTSLDVHAREDHSRAFRLVASEIGEEAEAGYRLTLARRAPEWDVGVQGVAHQRWDVDRLPADVAAFVPVGADLSRYLPRSFQLVSLITHIVSGDFLERARPGRASFPHYDCEAAAGVVFPDREGAVHLQCSASVLTRLGGYVTAIAFYNRGVLGIDGQQTAEAALSYSQTF
jgi:hypothetical protein